jgi:hypothetical protein
MVATPREFMEQVVPWPESNEPGFINLHWTSPKGPGLRGRPYRDLNSFMSMVRFADNRATMFKDIYFCLSRQSAVGKLYNNAPTAARTKECATHLKAIWLDVDVKPGNPEKNYGTAKEALHALTAFCAGCALPPPSALIFSGGGGFHAYWISKTVLTQEGWRPYAEGLKAAALRFGLHCDAGITTDAARLLRVPGTYNNKGETPKLVRLAHLGPAYDFMRTLASLVADKGIQSATVPTTVVPPVWASQGMAKAFQGLDPKADSLSVGIDHGPPETPLNPTAVLKGCVHYRDALVTRGKSHGEPLWALTLLGATWFERGRQWAHTLSEGHPDYGKETTDTKYDQKLSARERGTGWPSCQAFEAAGANCKTCPFRGDVRSPLNLVAGRVPAPREPAQIQGPDDPPLPDGYTVRPKDGWICKVVTKTLPGGATFDELAPLFMSKIRNPILQRGNRKIMFETSLDGDHWGPVSLYETDLATEQTLVKALRTHGCKPYPDNQKYLVQFMTSFTAKLDAAKARINTVSFGWLRKEEGGVEPIGFAYGGKVILSNGMEQAAGFSDPQIEAVYKPKGSEEPWRLLLKVVTDQCHPPIEVIMAVAFGAPLMAFTNQYNGVFCSHSPGAGTHKSTSIDMGAAVWGCPVLTKERPISSKKGLLRTAGHIRNLPVYLDEVSEIEHMDEVREIVNYLSEGSDGTKLHQDRTLFSKEAWQTLMLVGSNQSLYENILRNVQTTDAKLQRVFEFIVPPRPDSVDANYAAKLQKSLDYNYGHMGLLYSGMLGRDPAGIAQYVEKIHDKFNKEVDHVSPERFRSAMAAATFAGASLANQLGCSFHLPEMWDFLKEQYFAQRSMIKGSNTVLGTADNTVSMFTQFIKGIVQNVLTVHHLPAKRKGYPAAIAYISGPTRDRPYAIQARISQADRLIEVSRSKLRDWLHRNQITPDGVVAGLKTHFHARVMEKVDLSAGSGVPGGRETVLVFHVPEGSPFEGLLFMNAPMDMRPVATEDEPVAKLNGNGASPHVEPVAVDPDQLVLPLPMGSLRQ